MKTQPKIEVYPLQALARVAAALETTVQDLLLHVPAEWADPAAETGTLEVLDSAACSRLLALGQVARIGFNDADGPAVLPVNYAMAAGRVVFRTSSSSPLARLDRHRIAMEVDAVDPVRRDGWSVLVRGTVHTVHAEDFGPAGAPAVDPWPGGCRDVYVIVEPIRITGRRVLCQRRTAPVGQ